MEALQNLFSQGYRSSLSHQPMESTTSTASRVNACCGGSHNGGCTDAVSSPEGVGDSMSRMSLTTSAATPSTTTPTSSSTSAQSSKPLSSTNSTERIPRPQAGNAVKNASTTKSDDYDDEDDIVNADFMTAPSGGMHSYSGEFLFVNMLCATFL